ncbi:uncharacterized protein LOC114934343 [Nylanderia fulva]|uniref:uncharacterized protein LOC114934343 n=1 Tax=Nylanderia fulva TaxID=613905 RepID=UPI0010FB6FF8|nr:uncharacterized protein LOC114934343 [Nylanderia fulva]
MTSTDVDDFEELIAKQTQLMNSVNQALINFKKMGQSNMTHAVTVSRLARLKEQFDKIRVLDAKLQATASGKTKATDPYFIEAQFVACEDNYDECSDYMAEVAARTNPRLAAGPAPESAAEPAAAYASIDTSVGARPISRFPRIELPAFDGSIHRWETFRDRFKSMIIDDPCLSNVERMHYLCSVLTGDASNALNHLAVTDDNFAVAWNIITSRFENKRRLITAHLQTLCQLLQVATKTTREIQTLHDQTNMSIQALKNLGYPVLVFLVSQKLDKASRKTWKLKLSDIVEFPSYSKLDKFLENHIRALEAILPMKTNNAAKSTTVKTEARSVAAHATTTTKFECSVCKKSHPLFQCMQFLSWSPARQHELIKSQKRCFNCLAANHSIKDCKNEHRCRECHSKHHTLLHLSDTSRSSPEDSTTTSNSAKTKASGDIVSLTISRSTQSAPVVLLATARVRVFSTDGTVVPARALVDQGSAATLISERLAQLLKHLNEISLADRDPNNSDPIDIIIGADLHSLIIPEGLRKGRSSEPIPQNTALSWILSGPASEPLPQPPVHTHHSAISNNLDLTLRQFWEMEDLPQSTFPSQEKKQCKEHFLATHSRLPDGRYRVRLPFRNGPPTDLGDSKVAALANLARVESRLHRDPPKAKAYAAFLQKYSDLGHMLKVSETKPSEQSSAYYIPHHAVTRDSSTTTRLRIVFNASSRTSTGKFLNDYLLTGAKLQNDFCTVILQWRQYRYVLSADIANMYRQILVDSRDTTYLRILWRNASTAHVEEYRLLTVTYGTASAPFLALRVLQQLTTDDGSEFPLAISVMQRHIYVDDCSFGADDLDIARQTRDQLIVLLARGGFRLRKWASNCPFLISDIDPTDHGHAGDKDIHEDHSLNILGVSWHPQQDLPLLERITIPRWTQFSPDASKVELHGFADASTKAYAAVAYLRVVSSNDKIEVSLLAAKSKVAPIKTIDSTITLAWLRQSLARWKTFVANRVAQVQQLLSNETWRHVPTKDNPADQASRGLFPSMIRDNLQWWQGPS